MTTLLSIGWRTRGDAHPPTLTVLLFKVNGRASSIQAVNTESHTLSSYHVERGWVWERAPNIFHFLMSWGSQSVFRGSEVSTVENKEATYLVAIRNTLSFHLPLRHTIAHLKVVFPPFSIKGAFAPPSPFPLPLPLSRLPCGAPSRNNPCHLLRYHLFFFDKMAPR